MATMGGDVCATPPSAGIRARMASSMVPRPESMRRDAGLPSALCWHGPGGPRQLLRSASEGYAAAWARASRASRSRSHPAQPGNQSRQTRMVDANPPLAERSAVSGGGQRWAADSAQIPHLRRRSSRAHCCRQQRRDLDSSPARRTLSCPARRSRRTFPTSATSWSRQRSKLRTFWCSR